MKEYRVVGYFSSYTENAADRATNEINKLVARGFAVASVQSEFILMERETEDKV